MPSTTPILNSNVLTFIFLPQVKPNVTTKNEVGVKIDLFTFQERMNGLGTSFIFELCVNIDIFFPLHYDKQDLETNVSRQGATPFRLSQLKNRIYGTKGRNICEVSALHFRFNSLKETRLPRNMTTSYHQKFLTE